MVAVAVAGLERCAPGSGVWTGHEPLYSSTNDFLSDYAHDLGGRWLGSLSADPISKHRSTKSCFVNGMFDKTCSLSH